MADDVSKKQDDTTQDDGLLDGLKDKIPGNFEDGILDKISDAAEDITDKIPGSFDDNLLEKAKDMIDGLDTNSITDTAKDLNPFDKK